MTTNVAPDLERYWDAVADAVPVFTPEEQRAAVMLYRELAKGQPVGVEQLAATLNVPAAKGEELFQRMSTAGSSVSAASRSHPCTTGSR